MLPSLVAAVLARALLKSGGVNLSFLKLRLLLKLLALLAGRPVVVVLLVDERVLLVRDAGDVSSCFTVVVVAGPVAPTCVREGRVDGVEY